MARISHHLWPDDRLLLVMIAKSANAVAETPDSLLEAGVALHAAGDSAGAEGLFRQTLTLEPENPTRSICLASLASKAARRRRPSS